MAASNKNREKNKNIRKKSITKEKNFKKNAKCSKVTRKTTALVKHAKKSNKNKVKRKNYSSESVENALKAIDTGISISKAAAAYGIPKATLARKKSHPGESKAKSGPDTVLSKNIEQEIANWIVYKAERGQPPTKTELLDSVQFYVKDEGLNTPFVDGRPGRHWFEGFRKRHPNLSMRKPQYLSLGRAGVTREDLQEWFIEQKKYLENKDLLHISPSRIFNCDESSILLCPDSDKVLTTKSTRASYKVADAGKECLTVLFMYAADGTRAPPMLMFAYKEGVPKNIAEKTPMHWGIGISESGWMNSETFYEYITNVFYPWLIKEKVQFPVIIYLDNHSSHITIPLVGFCREKQIELIGLYPNSTHVMQPLDISFFHPFKVAWRKTVPKWKLQKGIMKLKKEHFPTVLKMALDNMEKEKETVISGFRAAGLVPFNPDAVDYDIFQKRKKSTHGNLPEQVEVREQQAPESQIENNKLHLKNFESNISPELLEEFKATLSNGPASDQWTGDVANKGLYDYWIQIRGTPTDDRKKPKINSIENLLNHKVEIISQESVNENLSLSDNLLNENNSSVVIQEVPANFNESLIEVLLVNSTSEENTLRQAADMYFAMNRSEENVIFNSICDQSISDQLIDINSLSCTNSTEQLELIRSENGRQILHENNQAKSISESRLLKKKVEVCDASSQQMDKENNSRKADKVAGTNLDDSFKKAFTLPVAYLPKKKKAKVESSGKPKLPAAGTADEWWNYNMQKEKEKQEKEEKLAKKKNLQDQKKILAEEKKMLDKKMKEITQKIKEEKI